MTRKTNALNWCKVAIRAEDGEGEARILQNDFETLFVINGSPQGAALFVIPDSKSRDRVFYFSPKAVAIARGLVQHFLGEPCPPPDATADSSLVLLVGHAHERELLLKGVRGLKLREKVDRVLGQD